MPWFLTPHGPHFVVEPGTIDEYERRDYVQMTAQQVTDYYAGVATPDPPSYATEAEVPGIVAADLAGGTGPVAAAAKAAFVPAAVVTPGAGDTRAAIQAKLNAGGIYLRAGTHTVAGSLTAPSGAVIDGEPGAVVKLAAAVNAPALTNADHAAGNTGIKVRRVAFDGNRAQQTADFAVVDMWRVTDGEFVDLDVKGGRRTTQFPNGTDGEGLVLRYSQRCKVRGGRFHDNDYDGIKLRSSDHNEVANVVCDENGRAGIQVSFQSPTGPPYTGNEGSETEGSDHNTFTNIVVRHSTGTAGAGAPITSGLYVHTGRFNSFSNFTVYGVAQGIGLVANASDNIFSSGTIRHRHLGGSGDAAVSIEGGANPNNRNLFMGLISRGLSGADGRHLRMIMTAALNSFVGCRFAKGDGTGTWTSTIDTGVQYTSLIACYADGTLTDNGDATVVMGGGWDFLGNYGLGTTSQFGGGSRVVGLRNAVTPPSANPAGGGVLYVEAGVLKYRGSGGTVTTLGPA